MKLHIYCDYYLPQSFLFVSVCLLEEEEEKKSLM